MLGVRHGAVCAACRLRAVIATKELARRKRVSLGLPSRIRLLSTSVAWQLPRARGKKSLVPLRVDGATRVEEELVDLSVEEKVLRVRRRYGDSLPEGVLGEEEMRVYERLYGEPLRQPRDGPGHVQELEAGEAEEGTGVPKLANDGILEKVEWEEEGVSKGGRRRKRGEVMKAEEDARVMEQQRQNAEDGEGQAEMEEEEDADPTQRTHPLTLPNRFGSSPTTLQLPKDSFVDPATLLLSGLSNTHLSEAAHRIFGGVGLPYSTSTPIIGKTMQQKSIALNAAQSSMSEMDADVYTATLMPGVFASVMGVLAETRKRLGSRWAEGLVGKAERGELRILDAGGAGAGVLAVREVIKAEWERMCEENADADSALALAEADGKVGGAGVSPPLGQATVLTGSDTLRKRASQLLDNTTFVPRLPDYVHSSGTAKQKGKFDIIVAPHTLWPLREDYVRKSHTQNLWSLLNQDGGVLVLLEKGVARGFELVAAAREMLLETRISSPESRARSLDIIHDPPSSSSTNTNAKEVEEQEVAWEGERSSLDPEPEPWVKAKDKGMIIAPCTNHTGCPMYVQKGLVKGRKDICHFEQRYVRPAFLQRILGARDKNFEDVRFSYLAVMRGRDLREEAEMAIKFEEVMGFSEQQGGVVQGSEATERAFEGFLEVGEEGDGVEAVDDGVRIAAPDVTAPDALPHSLSLPRAILPPLKRRGHVILDLCTPSGTLERWTVPRSYSKQAFRDARKSRWGDLWALGAKTRVLRSVRKNKHDRGDMDVKLKKRQEGGAGGGGGGKGRDGEGVGVDEYGRLVPESSMPGRGEGGRLREHKVKGIREKRDKKGKGNGRRKYQVDE